MKRKIVRLVAVAVALAGVLLASAPAQAQSSKVMDPVACTDYGQWFTASFGQWRWCDTTDATDTWYRFQVDDTVTDGYAVHIEICIGDQINCVHGSQVWIEPYDGGAQPWCTESVGPVVTGGWPGAYEDLGHVDVRLVKGSCSGTHQNVGSNWWHFLT